MFHLTFDSDDVFKSGFSAEGAPYPCTVSDCGGSWEPAMDGVRGLHWVCAKCGSRFVRKDVAESDDAPPAPKVTRLDGEELKPLVASARVHLDASVTLTVDFDRAAPKALKLVHSLLFWAERSAETRRGYQRGTRFGWLFAKVGDGWTVSTSRGHTAAKLVATKLVKPRKCVSCRAVIAKGERCYAEGRDQPYGYRQYQDARWCVPCVERTEGEALPDNVVRLNARRKATR